jgi:hypothetical protein
VTFRLESACGRQVHRGGQEDNPKQKANSSLSVMTHFQGCREEKIAYCTEHTIAYPHIPSALRPVKHDDSLTILQPSQQRTLHEEESTRTSPEEVTVPSCSSVDSAFPELNVPYLVSHYELSNIVTDLSFSKIQVVLLASRLQG